MPAKTPAQSRASIRLTMQPKHRKLVARLVKSGRFASTSEVVGAAMSLLEAEERDYAECVEGIRRGLADAAAGRERPAAEFFREFERKHRLRRPR